MDTRDIHRRRLAREFVIQVFTARGVAYLDDLYDVDGMVTEIVESGDLLYQDMSYMDFCSIADRHEISPDPPATQLKRIGWGVMIMLEGDDVEMITLNNPVLDSEEVARGHIRRFLNPSAEIKIFPIVE